MSIKRVILLMFENRSFDHMLGHLSYEGIQPEANGLAEPLANYQNIYNGGVYPPYAIAADTPLPFDVPHEWSDIQKQLALDPNTGSFAMNGFVSAYANATNTEPNPDAEPMGFFSSAQVPITSFLATKFCTCDNWFAALPSSTQPNRTMAFCGESEIYRTTLQAIPSKGNIFHWMNANNISWSVYSDGLPFFILYPDLIPTEIFSGNFRNYNRLLTDLQVGDAPQVIIVEPCYQDAPHIGSPHPNCNHAPLAIGWGEEFLRQTYLAVTTNPEVWAETLMVVYYDEHGGFADHIPPPAMDNRYNVNPPAGADGTSNNFNSLGPRIPAILVSPFVEPGSVCHNLFDHTSVLQYLAELFTPGVPYSDAVTFRSQQANAINSISAALADTAAQIPPPPPPMETISVQTAMGNQMTTEPDGQMGQAFEGAAQQLMANYPEQVNEKYPELNNWKNAISVGRV